MIGFNQDELDGLVESLRDQPGFITAAVVPAGSGDALIAGLRGELGDLKIEETSHRERAANLGAKAAELGQSKDGHAYVFILRLDEPEIFQSEDEAVQFWRELNYQREALGSGTVRTCLLLSEETEWGLALIADDLWDWTTIFRFPEAIRATVRTPADSEALVWADYDHPLRAENDLAILRNQWQRARQAELPHATLVESYAVPLFLALPKSRDAEAIEIWERDLRSAEAVGRLSPETSLLVARKMMYLAGLRDPESHRGDLIQGALTAADGAVATLERRVATHPKAFEPGLAAALSTSAKLHQDAGELEVASSQIEKCLDLLRRLEEVEGGGEAIIRTLVQRRWALLFLLKARDSRGLPLLEQVERLRAVEDPSLDDDVRSNALGVALEISITQPENPLLQANACLFTAWLLSNDSHLEGPRFERVLAHDPVSYCRSLEAFWQLMTRTRWEKLLIEPLIREWASNGSTCVSIREQLVSWLLHFWSPKPDGEVDVTRKDRIRSWTRLQWRAVRILGYRYDPSLLQVFCRYLSSLSNLGEDNRHLRYRASQHLGFMLRWSYQEPALQPLAQVATEPNVTTAELEAAKDLVYALRQESRSERTMAMEEESFSEQLKRGQPRVLSSLSLEEFCEDGPHRGIAELAGDPEVPDLTPEDRAALVARLRALIRTGGVRDDGGQQTYESLIFDAWIPWLARSDRRDWWAITTELIEQQIDLPEPQWALGLFPVLGIWLKDQAIARKIKEKLVLATGPEGEKLRENLGLLELLRWALHLEDSEDLLRCLEVLTEYTDFLKFDPIPWVMRWALDRPTFEAIGQRRRAASRDMERRLWFLVEWPFVDRLPPEDALAWCREIAPLAALEEDMHWMLVDQLARIDHPGALETAAEAKVERSAGPGIRNTWFQDTIPVHIHNIWDPEFSARPEHHAVRLQWLRSCGSDKDIAQHALAARMNGILSEVESIGKELLSIDRQLERVLGVSLLAWHPEGDNWLEPLIDSDPSAWVRQHAEWAIAVCHRDRLGRRIYREALTATDWLEQQARFEQLVPLVLPTFSLWPTWDEELKELANALDPRRKALLVDFRYYIGQRIQWKLILGRDLEKFCRGEDISAHLELGEKGPPWLRGVR